MPIYEFRCQECSQVSEFQLKIADPHPQTCPLCAKVGLKKIMSLPAFQLKGGGWYADSYDGQSNKKPEAKATENSGSEASPSKEAAPAAAEAKPASSAATPAAASPAKAPSSPPSKKT